MYKKPKRLKKGDSIAIVSPSWGGPSIFPHIYHSGIQNLRELGFEIVEYPTAKMAANELFNNPQARAEDLNNAFADPDIQGIISTIGGSDSARILKYLDINTIVQNAKFFMGYSDVTTISTYLNQNGLVTFNGPSIMAGFSQLRSFDSFYQSYIQDFLFNPQETQLVPTFASYSDGYPSWGNRENTGKINNPKPNDGNRWIQGARKTTGYLFGGCIEVLEMLKGTDYWPKKDFWKNRMLFLETSEDKPSIDYVKYALRNYGVMGVFDRISALLFGRARDYTDQEKSQLEKTVLSVIRDEFGNSELPIVCNLDFGHTDPQIVLPLGIKMEVDSQNRQMKLLESAFSNQSGCISLTS